MKNRRVLVYLTVSLLYQVNNNEIDTRGYRPFRGPGKGLTLTSKLLKGLGRRVREVQWTHLEYRNRQSPFLQPLREDLQQDFSIHKTKYVILNNK